MPCIYGYVSYWDFLTVGKKLLNLASHLKEIYINKNNNIH